MEEGNASISLKDRMLYISAYQRRFCGANSEENGFLVGDSLQQVTGKGNFQFSFPGPLIEFQCEQGHFTLHLSYHFVCDMRLGELCISRSDCLDCVARVKVEKEIVLNPETLAKAYDNAAAAASNK